MMVTERTPFPLIAYFRIVTGMVTGPGAFYACLGDDAPGLREAVIYLLFTALIASGLGTLVHHPSQPLAVFGILFANGIGMCFFAVMTGYIIMIMGLGKKASFVQLLRIYAFASGTTLLLSWVPFSLLFTELWKWWLIFTGLTSAGGFRKKEAALILVLSVAVIVLFFRSLLAVFA